MKLLLFIVVLGWFCCAALMRQQPSAPSADSEHVAENSVFLSPGDKFGVNLTGSTDGTTINVAYQPDSKKADLLVTFKKERKMMLLTIKNQSGQWLAYEAYMKLPERSGLYKTSVVPVGPHLSSFESWPQPIAELVLKNFRLSDAAPGQAHSR